MPEQQRYIYPPTTVEQLQALYSNPKVDTGFTTVSSELQYYSLIYDRSTTDKLKLPYSLQDLKIPPNELATSTTIYSTIDKIQKNFLYLNTRASISSNDLPVNFSGYYTCNNFNEPIFIENTSSSPTQVPVLTITGTPKHDPDQKTLDIIPGGEDLNQLTTGVWIRDNSVLSLQTDTFNSENYQYGFVASPNKLTVLKMSNNPVTNTTNVNDFGVITGSQGWTIINNFETIQDIPDQKNSLKYTNITKVKTGPDKKLYILDSGVNRADSGIPNISDKTQRGVIYKYNVNGYLNIETDNTITKDLRVLECTVGDVNVKSTQTNLVDPVAFTIGPENTIIVYDEYDYTFKIYDSNGTFIDRKPKRNTFFRGATGTKKQYLGVADIHYDIISNILYVLSPTGYVYTFDSEYKQLDKFIIQKNTSNQSNNLGVGDTTHLHFRPGYPGSIQSEQFIQLEFSASESNTYYVVTSNRVIKKFKSRPTSVVGVYNLLDNNIGMLAQTTSSAAIAYRAIPKFVSIVQEANVVAKSLVNADNEVVNVVDTDRSYIYDQMYMYCDFYDLSKTTRISATPIDINFLLSFRERIDLRSSLIKTDYQIYDIKESRSINHKEYNSDFSYNKLFAKIISNHIKMIKLLQYRPSASYLPTGDLVYKNHVYLNEKEHRELIVNADDSGYIGINEYFTNNTINRCISYIYNIQQSILKTLVIVEEDTWPSKLSDIPLEPYLYTSGNQFTDQDGIEYIGYYYIRTQTDGDIYVSGRNAQDGTYNQDQSPTTDRYLNIIT